MNIFDVPLLLHKGSKTRNWITSQRLNQLTCCNFSLKGIIYSFQMNPRMLRLTQNIQKYEVTCSTPPPAPDQKPQSTSSPVPNATTMIHIMLKYIYRHFGNRCLSKIFESYLEIPRKIYIFERSFKDLSKTSKDTQENIHLWKTSRDTQSLLRIFGNIVIT